MKPAKAQTDQLREVARQLDTDDREKVSDAMVKRKAKRSVNHASDCSVNSAPAYEPGPCDCGAIKAR